MTIWHDTTGRMSPASWRVAIEIWHARSAARAAHEAGCAQHLAGIALVCGARILAALSVLAESNGAEWGCA